MSLLTVEGLTTHIFTYRGIIHAVDNVHMTLNKGEAVGIVGESACGKSMTVKSIIGLIDEPIRVMSGKVILKGNDLLKYSAKKMNSVRGKEIGMIFQDPMTYLNPIMKIGDQIAEILIEHEGLSKKEAWKKAEYLLGKVKIPSPENVIWYYPHQLSGGMRQRILTAIAIACNPDIIIADEPTTALDVTTQAQVMQMLADLRKELDSALILITHDLALVAEYCDRIYVMYAGQLVEHGDVFSIFRSPKHPYTTALRKSSMGIDRKLDEFVSIKGQPPDLINPPSGCHFHPRCEHAMEICQSDDPPIIKVKGGEHRWVRCWLYSKQEKGVVNIG